MHYRIQPPNKYIFMSNCKTLRKQQSLKFIELSFLTHPLAQEILLILIFKCSLLCICKFCKADKKRKVLSAMILEKYHMTLRTLFVCMWESKYIFGHMYITGFLLKIVWVLITNDFLQIQTRTVSGLFSVFLFYFFQLIRLVCSLCILLISAF